MARRATDLLVQKERVLLREQRRLGVLQRRTKSAWETACRDAQTWVARAASVRGRRVMTLAGRPGQAGVDLAWRNSMGAYYPIEVTCVLPDDRSLGGLTGTSTATEASRAHRRALECAVDHAATARAVAEVERELAATRRRVRVLERHWSPALTTALHDLATELEERERDDLVHTRWSQREELQP